VGDVVGVKVGLGVMRAAVGVGVGRLVGLNVGAANVIPRLWKVLSTREHTLE